MNGPEIAELTVY